MVLVPPIENKHLYPSEAIARGSIEKVQNSRNQRKAGEAVCLPKATVISEATCRPQHLQPREKLSVVNSGDEEVKIVEAEKGK